MGQLTGVGDHLVVGFGVGELHPAEAQVQEEIPGRLQQLRVVQTVGAKDHAGVVEQVVLCVAEAGMLAARHGVSAEEMPVPCTTEGHQFRTDGLLHAAAVDHRAAGLEAIRMGLDPIDDRAGIQADQHHIAGAQRIVSELCVDGTHEEGLLDGLRVDVAAVHGMRGAQLDSAGQGAADEAQADNGNIHTKSPLRSAGVIRRRGGDFLLILTEVQRKDNYWNSGTSSASSIARCLNASRFSSKSKLRRFSEVS